jgi:photosystem II stability/assembly factor-like uncharacterized protein
VASSADGSKLVALGGSRIYTSTDSGATWTPRTDAIPRLSAVASSADGSKLIAAVFGSSGQLYTSTDSGESWTPHEPGHSWWQVASSADGSKLVAAELHGDLYTSTDGGMTWTARATDSDNFQNWTSVASSADGTKLVAVERGGRIHTSSDSGENWTAHESIRTWFWVASSADGSRLAAVDFGGNEGGLIYTSTAAITTTLGTDGSISGAQFDAITLQYVGGGMFNVLSHEGQLTAQ